MTYSSIQYTGNGSQQSFTFPFPYLQKADITVSINGVSALLYNTDNYLGSFSTAPTVDNSGNPLASGALYYNSVSGSMQIYSMSTWIPSSSTYVFSFTTANTIQISPAPVSGSSVGIQRKTNLSSSVVTFSDGSVLQSSDLDLLSLFSLYTAQESADAAGSAIGAGISAVNAGISEANAAASAATATAEAVISTNAAASVASGVTSAANSATTATTQATA